MVVAGVQCRDMILTVFTAVVAAKACHMVAEGPTVAAVAVTVCTRQAMAAITSLHVAVMAVEAVTHRHCIRAGVAWVAVVVTWAVEAALDLTIEVSK